MWKKPENPVPIGNDQLVIGVFVWINKSWSDHDFILNKFRITTEQQLKEVIALGTENIYWFPSKSTAKPKPPAPQQDIPPPPPPPVVDLHAERLKEKTEKVQRQRALVSKAERNWEKAAKAAREAMLGMRDNPRQAGGKMREFSQEAVQSVGGNEALLHLLGNKQGDGPQHHALNCMSLAILLAKKMGLPDAAVSEIALGALSHDIGKTLIPAHIFRAKARSKHEESLYRDHCIRGVELARISGAFSEGAIAAIQDHHERLDGSGFPNGRKGSAIGLSARIVAVINHYDRLCSPESPERESMSPGEALKKMWREEQTRLDPAVLTALIKLLGVYPPGTLVGLSDGSLGLVVSPGKQSLLPKVLIYDPEVPKDEAPILDLSEIQDLAIEETLRPEDIPADVLEWISPRERLTYYFSGEAVE
jgi:HD-GYP domain-containing protein (c-di-GMP phosphodiesterase class II)